MGRRTTGDESYGAQVAQDVVRRGICTLRELQEKEYLPLVKPDFFASGEQDEGARAFLEKRKPNFDAWR